MTRQAIDSASRLPGILVVDDERQIVDLLTRYLTQHGFHAIGCYTAAEARAQVRGDARIAVLVTDVRMPGESGPALAEELIQDRPDGIALEVVLISGADLEDTPGRLSRQGFELLRKPFRPSELVAAVSRALARNDRRRGDPGGSAPAAPAAEPAGGREPEPGSPDALRAPLMPIIAAAEALVAAAALDEAETREQARRIHAAAMRLLAMIGEAEPQEDPAKRDNPASVRATR
ncbi:response regulator [Roseomonas sp. AR75]|uniref:response regulator n=1 Tax=Roseomonas sp. AR75 TaxID=2562311 RepID=UPI0010C09068|nr:response regulator [Roseomonas sp. AR75]